VGDSLAALPAVLGLKARDGGNVAYHCKHHDWVRLWYEDVAEESKDHVDLNKGYIKGCFQKEKGTRTKRYCDVIGVKPVMPQLREREKLYDEGQAYRGCIALCQGSCYDARQWSLQNWLHLESLLIGAGYKVVIFDSDAERCKDFKSDKLIGQGPRHVVSVLLNCEAIVSVDSGLAHVGGLIGTKTFVLEGPTTAEGVFGFYPSVEGIKGKMPCHGCYWSKPFSDKNCVRCPSLWAIDPATVLEAVDKHCLHKLAPRACQGTPELITLRNQALAVKGLVGDVGEVGSYRGGSAKLLLHYTEGPVHLFDTFAGQPGDDQDGKHKDGEFADTSADEVKQYLASDRVRLHVGNFPSVLPSDDTRYKLAVFDADTYQACKAFIDYFAPRMVPTGRMVFLDFNWQMTPGVARAVYERYQTVEKASEYTAVVRA
jgi:hypothetical protein